MIEKLKKEIYEAIEEKGIDFRHEMSKFMYPSKYAKYLYKEKRREILPETIDRSENMHIGKYGHILTPTDIEEVRNSFDKVREKFTVPSMRGFQFAGPAILANEAKGFNCSAGFLDSIRAFSEGFNLLMCGCGVTFGLHKDFLKRIPDLVSSEDKTGSVLNYVIEDSIAGWSDTVGVLLECYTKNSPLTGRKIVFDYSKIRKKGSRLKTSGGLAPGHKGLKSSLEKIKELLDYLIEVKHLGRLRSIDCYDIMMHCADAVLSGGIRRAATAIIFENDDLDMMEAKTTRTVEELLHHSINEKRNVAEASFKLYGDDRIKTVTFDLSNEGDKWAYKSLVEELTIGWFYVEPQRGRSNNSVRINTDTVTLDEFHKIITRTRQFGEPAFVFTCHKYYLANPCFEIGFVPVTNDGRCGYQMCNLTSINGSKIDTLEKWMEAAKAATIIGTLQAGYTKFSYLTSASQELTEEEALLGVSITGMMENVETLFNPENQRKVARYCVEINELWARKIGINPAARINCIKPEGSVSLFLQTCSGIHPEHAKPFYIRRIQANKIDAIYSKFKEVNPHACEESVWSANRTDEVISFPIYTKPETLVKNELGAIQHLEMIKLTQLNWVHTGGETTNNHKKLKHNVSCTVIVKPEEWGEVTNYLFKNRELFTAVSLLASSGDKDYQQAPNEEMTTEDDLKKYLDLVKKWKPVVYNMREETNEVDHQAESACAGGACSISRI